MSHPRGDPGPHQFRLPSALAVHDGVIGVALERAARELPGHVSVLFAGSIEHLMRDLFAPTDRALSQFGAFHELAPITTAQWQAGIRRRLADDQTEITGTTSAWSISRLGKRSALPGRLSRTT